MSMVDEGPLTPGRSRLRTILTLEMLSALFAFGAAILWLFSAIGSMPGMLAHFELPPIADMVHAQMEWSVVFNRYAAISSCCSAVCLGIATTMKIKG
jgi:hypothetical protein